MESCQFRQGKIPGETSKGNPAGPEFAWETEANFIGQKWRADLSVWWANEETGFLSSFRGVGVY